MATAIGSNHGGAKIMMTSKKIRILQDLWVSLVGGYAGIPQDTRLNFNVLSQCDALELDGLLYTKRKHLSLRKKTIPQTRDEIVMASNQFLHDALEDLPVVKSGIVDKIKMMVSAEITNTYLKRKYSLFPIDPSHYDMLWRNVFSKSLAPEDKDRVLQKQFYYSDISWRDVMFAGYFNRKTYLNTEGYDFVLFPDVRPITVSPTTKKIVRYHDSFAFLCPDFFQTHHAMMHLNSLKACVKDSYFVCNSGPTKDVLISIFPEIEAKTFVVPPVVGSYKKVINWQAVKQICRTRLSKKIVEQTLENNDEKFEYILALSTLEPRKNYVNLIRAWENLFYTQNKKIKLIIVANPGWLSEEIESVMRPHIEMGNIIHLHNVSSEEIPYLLSHAKFFAALSFIEGFGIPAVEAMQCECPVLASDNPTHRWVLGDAALYVNPYDVDDIADGMMKLMGNNIDLANKGLLQIKKYQPETVMQQWVGLLEKI
jgi:glycosyltransferase involved in cell wall biosynthesis